jgi:hypothetical protein
VTHELYTQSRLRVLRTCLRRHHYRFRLGLVDPGSDATAFGNAGHAAVEAWLRAWQSGDVDGRLVAMMLSVESAPLSEIERARLRAVLVGYHFRWESQPWDVLAIEQEFRYPFDVYDIGGKIDGIVRNRDSGQTLLLEHKFTGRDTSPGSSYWEKLTIDLQLSIYTDGAASLGYQVDGCIYDVIAKPQHELREATPLDRRTYTQGKKCKLCVDGEMPAIDVAPARMCAACRGTGWKEAPRLHANQRTTAETIDDFEGRIREAIIAAPEDFYMRKVIVRPEAELSRMRLDVMDWIKLDQITRVMVGAGEPPRNDDACFQFHQRCPYLAACKGEADITDPHVFPRGVLNPELARVA